MLEADIETHEPAVKSVNRSGASLSDDPAVAPEVSAAVDGKLRDLNGRFNSVADRCRERGEDLKSVSRKLRDFNDSASNLQQWIVPTLETLESKETAHLDTPQFKEKLSDITMESQDKEDELERLKDVGDTLVQNPKTGDVSKVKDTMTDLGNSWQDLQETLDEKRREAGQR